MLLFAYGTLLHRTGNAKVDQVLAENLKDLGAAWLAGRLYSLGAYPGAVALASDAQGSTDSKSKIWGRLFELKDAEKSMVILDAYEDFNPFAPQSAEFAPKTLTVRLDVDQSQHLASVYLYCRRVEGLTEITSGDWMKWREENHLLEQQSQHLISPNLAEGLISRFAQVLGSESIPLSQVTGRVLAEVIRADRELPPYDRVAMDGIAVAGIAWEKGQRQFRIAGRAFAGQPQMTLENIETAIEVMTGTVLPMGCDRVIRVEDVEIKENNATVNPGLNLVAGRHIHRKGVDRNIGDTLLLPGQILGAPQVGILASVGKVRVQVARQPRIALVATGEELIPIDQQPLDHQIRISNAPALAAALQRFSSHVDWVMLGDDSEVLRTGLSKVFLNADLVIVTGGVSMGAADLIPQTLIGLGVREVFHKVKQKPGKPLWFGVTSEHTPGGLGRLVFGLPGNPMSVLLCYLRYVTPALCRLSGQASSLPDAICLGEEVPRGPRGFTVFVPAKFQVNTKGLREAFPLPHQGSGDFSSLGMSDGFIALDPTGLPEDAKEFSKGFVGHAWGWG